MVEGMRCVIVPAAAEHVGMLDRVMRDDDRAEATCFGLVPRAALWRSYRGAVLCKTVFVDDHIAAMFGLGGGLMADEGHPFLITSHAIERVPIWFSKRARVEMEGMLALRRVLSNIVDARYTRAIRFLEMLGFIVEAPERLSTTGALVRRFHITRGAHGS